MREKASTQVGRPTKPEVRSLKSLEQSRATPRPSAGRNRTPVPRVTATSDSRAADRGDAQAGYLDANQPVTE